MALTALQGGRGISFDDYFKQALNLDVSKLEAIIRGQDHSMPIVAAMAAYEVKKPMATAAAGQQAMQQLQQAHPTVRQEMEQEMQQKPMIPDMAMLQQQRMGAQPPVLPEQAGVGALPAPNMQGMAMAHGGIIAFDDGGDVPGYAGGDLMSSVPPPKNRGYSRSITDKLNTLAGEEGYQRELFQPVDPDKEIAKLQQQMASLPPDSPQRGLLQSRIDALLKMPKSATNQSDAETARLQRQAADTSGPPVGLAPQPSFTDVPARKASTPRGGVGTPAPSLSSTPPQPVGIDAALAARDKLSNSAEDDMRKALKGYETEAVAGIDSLRKAREEGKPTGKPYERYEASLMKDEAAAKGKEDRNLQMALVNAGLAIAGGTSRYALENIGKGAMVGTKQYMEGVDKLEAAAKERQKALAMIEEARRAEARGDWKDKNEFEAKATEVKLGAKKLGVEGLSKIYDVNTRTAADIFNTMETNATRERMAKEQNATELKKAGIMASAYSARQSNPNIAVDNAKARLDSWLKSPEGKMAALKPGAVDAKYDEYLREAFSQMGLQPPGGRASEAGGSGSAMFDYTPGKGLVPVR